MYSSIIVRGVVLEVKGPVENFDVWAKMANLTLIVYHPMSVTNDITTTSKDLRKRVFHPMYLFKCTAKGELKLQSVYCGNPYQTTQAHAADLPLMGAAGEIVLDTRQVISEDVSLPS